MRVHKNDLDKNGWPQVGAFRNRSPEGLPLTDADGMSTDWAKHATAQDTLQRAKTPSDNIVVRLIAGKVRQIPEQIVEHTPIEPNSENSAGNRAHSDVRGNKKLNPEVRVKFRKICMLAQTHDCYGVESDTQS